MFKSSLFLFKLAESNLHKFMLLHKVTEITSNGQLLEVRNGLFHGADIPSSYLMPEFWHEPMHCHADHLLLPFLTNSSAIIT